MPKGQTRKKEKKINVKFKSLNKQAMKKSTLMKLAFTLIAVFGMLAAEAQTYPATIQDPAHANAPNYVQVSTNTKQTTGIGFTLYVAPDPVYSPLYAGVGTTGINPASQWQWAWGTAADGTGGAILKTWSAQNYLAVLPAQMPAAGSTRTFWSTEMIAAGCADLVGRSHVLTVLPAPTGTLIGSNTGGTWTVATAGTEFYRCGTGYTDDLVPSFSEAGTDYDAYAYTVTVSATPYNAAGAPGATVDVTGTYGISKAATIATFVASGTSIAIPALMAQLEVPVGTKVRTKYVFTLATVASRMSTLSHYREGSANTFYPVAGQTVTYWLNLPPVTGPIYHIPNNFAGI